MTAPYSKVSLGMGGGERGETGSEHGFTPSDWGGGKDDEGYHSARRRHLSNLGQTGTKTVSILIVEDNLDLLDALEDLIRSNFPEIPVAGAVNSTEAMERIEADRPELVFMDIKIPGENGLKLTEKIKERYPAINIVVNTNYDFPEYEEAAYGAGADRFLSKNAAREADLVKIVRDLHENAVSAGEESADPGP